MDEGTANDTIPDLKDIETKIGRKTPEGLLRWMREDASSLRGETKLATPQDTSKDTGRKSLDEKIRKLRMEMAYLRSVDVKILQQLLVVHEGIEGVKWLMEERSTLTSHCSSLTSSQYSLGEGPDTSWRGSWSSLQDPTNDKLDNISIGSYLDTLADDMDEYCPSSSESVICSTTPLVSEATPESNTTGGPRVSGAGAAVGARSSNGDGNQIRTGTSDKEMLGGPGVSSAITGPGGSDAGILGAPVRFPQVKSNSSKENTPVRTKPAEMDNGSPVLKDDAKTQMLKVNGVLEKTATQTGSPTRKGIPDKLGTRQSPKAKQYKNGKIDLDTCKMNGKMHLEYDAHWRWVQSQEDVTFL
ncbi:leucine rich adaptor protein 1 [Xiphophorus hellerii]|uniref:leucine rich adaptor protein 1 n=1 Tax=Xiphophorus hellerii TaxID=8084 RepID=UPI0013B388EB|nr:leucine rich adaptor protein 1-like [Xiphophorus hellerii]